MPSGGDIIEITWNHPTLGSGTIFPKAGEDSTYDLGGFTSEDDAQGIDGGGNNIDKVTRKRWSFEVPIAWEMLEGNTLDDLQNMAEAPLPGDWTFTNINGVVFSGKGKPVGDLTGNGNTSLIPLKVSGGGRLKKL